MRKIIFNFLLAIIVLSCSKDTEIKDVLTNFEVTSPEIIADGHSTTELSVILSDKSSPDRRNVVFKTSLGLFTANGLKSYTSKAEFENGILIARATLKSTTTPGEVKLSVKPEFDSSIKEYVLYKSINAIPSMVSSLDLETSSFGLASNYLNEVKFTGVLKNSNGKFVSSGYTVQLQDELLSGINANGNFRENKLITTDSSKISCFYSADTFVIGTKIKIRCKVYDQNGNETSVKDSIILTINQ